MSFAVGKSHRHTTVKPISAVDSASSIRKFSGSVWPWPFDVSCTREMEYFLQNLKSARAYIPDLWAWTGQTDRQTHGWTAPFCNRWPAIGRTLTMNQNNTDDDDNDDDKDDDDDNDHHFRSDVHVLSPVDTDKNPLHALFAFQSVIHTKCTTACTHISSATPYTKTYSICISLFSQCCQANFTSSLQDCVGVSKWIFFYRFSSVNIVTHVGCSLLACIHGQCRSCVSFYQQDNSKWSHQICHRRLSWPHRPFAVFCGRKIINNWPSSRGDKVSKSILAHHFYTGVDLHFGWSVQF